MQRLPGKDYFTLLTCWSSDHLDLNSNVLEGNKCESAPLQFYLECVWFCGGITVVLIYIHAMYMNNSIWCGIYATVSYFMCHSFAGIIYEKPMARENFALPVILLQIFYVALYVENLTKRRGYKVPVLMVFFFIHESYFFVVVNCDC